MINNDLPIGKASEDLLNRSTFAKSLSKAILSYDQPSSFAIGLYGKWGSGKTSILNMIIENVRMLDKEVAILRFNPWLCSDPKQMIVQFFKQLSNAMGTANDKLSAACKIIDQFADVFQFSSYIPTVGSVVGILGNIVSKKAKEYIDKNNADLQKKKNDIIKKLEEQKVKIVVSIDDIDRLSESEIVSVFQLVKSLADFPNTIYLLSFDYEVVVNALDRVQTGKGKEYLEKVIQVPIGIPACDMESVYNVLFSKLDSIMDDTYRDKFNVEEWQYLFEYGIKEYIQTIRDVIRYMNVFSLKYSLLKNETDVVDLLGLTCLQVFEPEVYSKLYRCKKGLCGRNETYSFNGKNGRVEETREVKEFISSSKMANSNAVESILAILFPRFYDVLERRTVLYFGYNHGEYYINNKVSAANSFERYFSLMLENGTIPTDQLIRIILSKNKEEISKEIQQLNSEGKIYRLIDGINAYLSTEAGQKLSEERIIIIIKAIIHEWSSIDEKNREFLLIPINTKIEFCVMRLLKQLKPDSRKTLLLCIFASNKTDLSTLSILLQRVGDQYSRYSEFKDKDPDPLLAEDDVVELENIFVNIVKNAMLIDEQSLTMQDIGFMWLLRKIDPSVADQVNEKLIQNDYVLVKIIKQCQAHGGALNRPTKKLWKYRPKKLDIYISPDDAYERMSKFVTTEKIAVLPEDDIMEIGAFLYFMEHKELLDSEDNCISEDVVKERVSQFMVNKQG